MLSRCEIRKLSLYRFHDVAWSEATESHSLGIIAGALESGSLDLWDAAKLKGADAA
jgi:protein transport protein SEC31